jgi:hypothetical protein
MILLRQGTNVVGSREGWELYIVTGGVAVGISYPLLPTTLSTYLSRIMFDSLMLAF